MVLKGECRYTTYKPYPFICTPGSAMCPSTIQDDVCTYTWLEATVKVADVKERCALSVGKHNRTPCRVPAYSSLKLSTATGTCWGQGVWEMQGSHTKLQWLTAKTPGGRHFHFNLWHRTILRNIQF